MGRAKKAEGSTMPTTATLRKVKDSILGNPHLHSARTNRDYLTIGIEIAPEFKALVQRCYFEDKDKNKFHADMVPEDVCRAAMALPVEA